MTNETNTQANDDATLTAALRELQDISSRWHATDSVANPVRAALDTLFAVYDETNDVGEAEAEAGQMVTAGEITEEQLAEALARFYGVDEDGRTVNEDGSRV